MSALRSQWAALLVFVGVALWLCWPATPGGSGVYAQRDALFSAVSHQHLGEAWRGAAPWWHAPLGWPLPATTTLTDWTAGQALLTLPLVGLDVAGIENYAFSALLGLVLTAFACHLAARALLGSGPHTWVAGLIGGLSPMQLSHAHHINLIHHELTVLAPLALAVGLARGHRGLAAIGGAATALSFHFGLYMGVHTVFVVGVLAVLALIARVGDRRTWVAAVLGMAAAGVTLVPVGAAYIDSATTWGIAVGPGELLAESWDLRQTLAPLHHAPVHRWLGAPPGLPTLDPPNPGYVAVTLAVLGLIMAAQGPRWVWVGIGAATICAGALALGPEVKWDGHGTGIPGPGALLLHLPGGLRGPARWLSVATIGLGLFSAAGARWLADRGVRGGLALALLVLLILGERIPADPGTRLPTSPVYDALAASTVPGPVHDALDRGCDHRGEARLSAALEHRRPLVGGRYARAVSTLRELDHILGQWPAPAAVTLLRASGVRLVLDHPPLTGSPPPGWTCEPVDGHRLCVDDTPWSLPASDAVSLIPQGEPVGLRWAEPPSGDTVALTCGDAPHTAAVPVWALLAEIRQSPDFDVFPNMTCPTLTAAGAVPIYRSHDGVWP